MAPQATSRPHSFLTEWLLLIGGLLVVASVIASSLYEQRADHERHERDRLAIQARVVDDIVGRQLTSINLALVSVRAELPFWGVQKDGMALANRRLRAFTDAMPSVRTMAVMDAAGTILAANRPEIIGQNFRQRDYFQAPQRHPHPDTLYVAPPFRTSLGVWSMNLVRMIVGPQGQFNGIVLATLDPDEFRVVFGSVLYAPDMWSSIAHGDGLQFLMEPKRNGQSGIDLAKPGSFFTRHRDSGATANVMTGITHATGEHRMMALRTIQPPELKMDKPLVIAVGREMNALYADWWRAVWVYAGFFGLLVFSSVPGLYLLQRRRRIADREVRSAVAALQESRERLSIAADSAGIGVWDLDLASNRLLWDDWMFRIHGIAPDAFDGTQEAWRRCVHREDIDRVMQEAAHVLNSGEAFNSDFRIIRPDGAVRHVKAHAKIICDADGKPARMTGVNFDITESKLNADLLKSLNAELSEQSEILQSLAFIDGLTGVANRRHFDDSLHAEWRRCRRDHAALALLMVDIDHFKLFNDHYGHQAGDACLQSVAAMLKEQFGRSHDVVARYGGEEFACLMPESGIAGALSKAEELRLAVEGLGIAHKTSPIAPVVTISVGVAALVPDAETNPDQLLAAADAALYAAKHGGRNRVGRSV